MSDLDSLIDDDDTGKLRTEAAKGPSSNPGRDVTALAVAFIAHEKQDTRRHRQTLWLMGVGYAVAAAVLLALGGWAWAAQADSGAERARLEDVQRRLDRIEQQIDRLVERSEDR